MNTPADSGVGVAALASNVGGAASALPMSNEAFAAFMLADPLESRSAATVGALLDRLIALGSTKNELQEALTDLVAIINSAGLMNLSNGVQLGPASWFVKATERLDYATKVLAKASA